MKKTLIMMMTVLLAIAAFTGAVSAAVEVPAAAEEALTIADYTSVSKIPMAVDFTVSVEFDDAGKPHIVTDYPFDATGATEMYLRYNKSTFTNAIELKYDYLRSETSYSAYFPAAFSGEGYAEITEEAGKMIRNGELTLDDSVRIGTVHRAEQTSWYLMYSISRKTYVGYEEKTKTAGRYFLDAGGVEKSLDYTDGKLSGSSYRKQTENAHLNIILNQHGVVESARIFQYRPEYKYYDFDESTGLFDGKKISELDLGFEEEDLQVKAPAALKKEHAETETVVSKAEGALPIDQYTSLSKIPMAVDFTFSLEFDDKGNPHVVTDYPFEAMGATEMNLTYKKGDIQEAITVNYRYDTGETRAQCYDSRLFSYENKSDAWEMIRNGELTLADKVVINTSHFNKETDWFLTYSIGLKQYVEYEEISFAQTFNAIGFGGVKKSLEYFDGKLTRSNIMKRTEKADLRLAFSPYGTLVSAYVAQYRPETNYYSFDESTGLFDGKKISELDLGFEEEDLQVKAPAALEKEPAETETEADSPAAAETLTIADYTSVSKIPMAVDFTVSMEFDDAGIPHIVTDYPFDATGATEMNLTYNTENVHAAVTVNYQYRTGTIETKSFNSKAFPSGVPSGVWEMIRNGELTLDDIVAVNTSFFSERTDWFLLYSISQKQYVQYEEMTFAMAYGWINPGGTSKRLNYSDGRLNGSFYEKCTDKAELTMTFDPYGTLVHASILQFGPEGKNYPFDESTGLFDGKKISELDLGFEETDLPVKAPAALEKEPAETETAALKAVEAPVIAEYTSVSKIPMAVDFTVSVEFDDEGQPHIVTDYPFEATGATEMILQYNKKLYRYAVVLTYDPATGKTRCGGYYSQDFLGTNEKPAQGSEMIRTGELTLDDKIWIGTTNHNEQTGWYLEYSIREKNYVTYKEKTQSEGFNVMGAGGEMRQISYDNGMISGSHYTKRTENADLSLLFDKYGDVKKGYVSQNQRGGKSYDYDPVSGLFAGKKISELGLGFEDKDVQVYAPAVLKTEQGKTEPAAVTAVEKPSMDEFTEVSKIPMAVDFTVSVEFDDAGKPQIVTDYPFEAMGATEMNLEYSKKDFRYAIELTYDAVRKETRFGAYYPNAFSSDDYYGRIEEASQMIRDGVLTMEDGVWVGTTYENEQTDWYLEYSISKKTYVTYEERTQSQGFNAMGAGGIGKTINYVNGTISKSSISKRMENADMILSFDRNGNMLDCYISQYRPERNYYDYNPTTGLFGGKKISELGLGFEEADPQMPAPAALKAEQEQAETAPATVETEQAKAEPAAPAAEEAPGTDAGQETADPKLFGYKVKEDGTAEITSVSEMITDGRIPAELDGYAVTSIGKRAFQNCNKLSEAVIPEGVTTIGEWAFYSCDKLKTISIPDSVQEIEQVPFLQCNNLETITISPNHPVYAFSNHALISKKDMKLIAACGMGAQYEVSWGITEIGEDAFCSGKLKSVILPDSVQKIGMCAFTGAYNLEEAFIPEGVKVIETQAFMHCRKLKSVTIPDSVYRIGFGLFNDCNMLATVEISENHPVYEVKDLVLIDKRTKEIISSAGRIEGVYTVPEGIQSIATVAFQECDFMTEIIIPDSVTEIGHGALPEFNNLICRGGEGSCAQEYCKQNGITFEVMKNEE